MELLGSKSSELIMTNKEVVINTQSDVNSFWTTPQALRSIYKYLKHKTIRNTL